MEGAQARQLGRSAVLHVRALKPSMRSRSPERGTYKQTGRKQAGRRSRRLRIRIRAASVASWI